MQSICVNASQSYLCSVFDVESEAERKRSDAAIECLFHVHRGVNRGLADFMQLPLEGGACQARVVQSDLPGVITLLQREAHFSVEFLLLHHVFHLGTYEVIARILVEIHGGIVELGALEGWRISFKQNTPMKRLIEVAGQTAGPLDIIERGQDALPGFGDAVNHAIRDSPGHVHGGSVVLGDIVIRVVLNGITHIAETDSRWSLILVHSSLREKSHILESFKLLRKEDLTINLTI